MADKLETKCAALSLPSRYCIVRDGYCDEKTRYECEDWRKRIQPVHQKQHATRMTIFASMMYNEQYEFEGEAL